MKVLLLDNFDSFTFNIVHYLEGLDCEVKVVDNMQVEQSDLENTDCLLISPGPGLPYESGKLMHIIDLAVKKELPILGICLGMQAIAEYFGGKLFNQQQVKHGRQEKITHNKSSLLFKSIPETINVGLYHSWAVENPLPESLVATAFSESGIMMAVEHKSKKIFGVQFHPESIMSDYGKELLGNFIEIV